MSAESNGYAESPGPLPKLCGSLMASEGLQRQSRLKAVPLKTPRLTLPAVGCVGSMGALQDSSSSPCRFQMKLQKLATQSFDAKLVRAGSIDSTASTADSDSAAVHKHVKDSISSNSSMSAWSRQPSKESSWSVGSRRSSKGSSQRFVRREATRELDNFKEGKVSFNAVEYHFQRKDPDIRRLGVEAAGMAITSATLESTKAVVKCLSDSDSCVRQASVKSLCAVMAKTQSKNVFELAWRSLFEANTCTKYDAIEELVQLAMQGSNQAYNALDGFRSKDKDPLIRLKAEAEISLVSAAGYATNGAVQGAKVVLSRAKQGLLKKAESSWDP